MTDEERDALIGRAVQEHKRLKQTLACLKTKAGQMQKAVADGLLLLKGDTTGQIKDGELYVAESPHSMRVKGCDWPSKEEIGALVTERIEAEKQLADVEQRLRDMGMGDYAR